MAVIQLHVVGVGRILAGNTITVQETSMTVEGIKHNVRQATTALNEPPILAQITNSLSVQHGRNEFGDIEAKVMPALEEHASVIVRARKEAERIGGIVEKSNPMLWKLFYTIVHLEADAPELGEASQATADAIKKTVATAGNLAVMREALDGMEAACELLEMHGKRFEAARGAAAGDAATAASLNQDATAKANQYADGL